MTVYMCDIYVIKKHSQVKVILAFTVKSLSSCFFIHYIYNTHVIVVNLEYARTIKKFCDCWNLCSFHYVRYPTHTINICFHKENRLVVVPFAANGVFRIMEITFIHLDIFYFLSISAPAFDLTVLFLWCKFHCQKVYRSMLAS